MDINAKNQLSEIFKDRSILLRDYIPDDIVGRVDEQHLIYETFVPLVYGENALDLLVMGEPGHGKRSVIVSTLRKIIAEAEKKNPLNKYRTFIFDFLQDITAEDILQAIIGEIGGANYILDCQSIEDYLSLLWDLMNINRVSIFIVWIDPFNDAEAWKTILTNITIERMSGQLDNNLFIKFVASFNKEDDRPREAIVFSPYDADDLNAILYSRIDEAFIEGVLNEGIVPMCAAYAMRKFNADAGKALMILELAGELAELENANQITEDHIKRIVKAIIKWPMLPNINRLNIQHRLLLLSIFEESEKCSLDHQKMVLWDIHEHYIKLAIENQQLIMDEMNFIECVKEIEGMGWVKFNDDILISDDLDGIALQLCKKTLRRGIEERK